TLKAHLDRGKKLPFPNGILINGRGNDTSFSVEQAWMEANGHSLAEINTISEMQSLVAQFREFVSSNDVRSAYMVTFFHVFHFVRHFKAYSFVRA
ncbi:hypothetical protein SDJN02_12935, partial [Cucurbita argyrosperma subsp. argyrosperma]